jgi:hypothetical protein
MRNLILVLLVTACFALGCGWQARGQAQKADPPAATQPQARRKTPEPVEVYKGLRDLLLTFDPDKVGIEKPGPGEKAFAVLMEMGFDKGLASITSVSNGDSSLYAGNGGGVIGNGGSEEAKRTARDFVNAAGKHLPRMAATKEFPYAEVGRVRFYVRTPDGVYTAEAGQDEMLNPKHPLHALFRAGNEVITQLRLTSEKK